MAVQELVVQHPERKVLGVGRRLFRLFLQLLPASPQVSKDGLGIRLLPKRDADLLERSREEARELTVLGHDLIIPFQPDGHNVRTLRRLKDQSRDTPFEVTHRLLRRLVDLAFREDVDPRVRVARVRGRSQIRVATHSGIRQGDI